MNHHWLSKVGVSAALMLFIITVQAESECTISAATDTKLTLPSQGRATVRYQITNNSQKQYSFEMKEIVGVRQQTTSGYCSNPFSLEAGDSCILELHIRASAIPEGIQGFKICQYQSEEFCYQPKSEENLEIAVSDEQADLAKIAIYPLAVELVEGGEPQTVSLTNESNFSVHDLNIAFSPGSTVTLGTNTCPAILDEFAICTVSFVPGSQTETNSIARISGKNTQTSEVNITVSPVLLKISSPTLNYIVNEWGLISITNTSTSTAIYNLQAVIPESSHINIDASHSNCESILAANSSCDMAFTGTSIESNTDIAIQGTNTNSQHLTITVSPPLATTLSSSQANLALAVNGIARTLTIRNTGSSTAFDVSYSVAPDLPAGTSISPATCGTIASGASCVLTISPGATPTAAAMNTNPRALTLTISGTNTNSLTSNIHVLTYASVYQSGLLFDIDDSTPASSSIGGKVLALSDDAVNVTWSYDTNPMIVWGINELSTASNPSPNAFSTPAATQLSGQENCIGAKDGVCNTANIVSYYDQLSVPQAGYAAGICNSSTVGGYKWYLPGICEMGGRGTNNTGCQAPGGQTIVDKLAMLKPSNGCTGSLCFTIYSYWSSTEVAFPFDSDASGYVWYQVYNLNNYQFYTNKYGSLYLRCVHALT